jgi:hypothetical protein
VSESLYPPSRFLKIRSLCVLRKISGHVLIPHTGYLKSKYTLEYFVLSVLAVSEIYKYITFCTMLHRYMLRLLLVRGAKTVLLVGGLAVRNRTNGLRRVAVLHRAVSFYGIGPNEK